MELIVGKKYKVIVGRFDGEFEHQFKKGTIVEYTGAFTSHSIAGLIYKFKSKNIRNWLKEGWVIPVNNNIKKLG